MHDVFKRRFFEIIQVVEGLNYFVYACKKCRKIQSVMSKTRPKMFTCRFCYSSRRLVHSHRVEAALFFSENPVEVQRFISVFNAKNQL